MFWREGQCISREVCLKFGSKDKGYHDQPPCRTNEVLATSTGNEKQCDRVCHDKRIYVRHCTDLPRCICGAGKVRALEDGPTWKKHECIKDIFCRENKLFL